MSKEPQVNIYRSIRRNNTIVWGLLVAFLVGMLLMCNLVFRMYKYNLNHVLTLDKKGEVLPLTWIPRDENLRVEMKHHIEMFMDYFYQYDRYNWQKRIDRSLWLADESVEKLFLKREDEGWFNEVTNLGYSQRLIIQPDSIKVYGNKEPFEFEVPAFLIIENQAQKNTYYFRSRGFLLTVNRNYPLNPHGLLITKYQETNKKLVSKE